MYNANQVEDKLWKLKYSCEIHKDRFSILLQ